MFLKCIRVAEITVIVLEGIQSSGYGEMEQGYILRSPGVQTSPGKIMNRDLTGVTHKDLLSLQEEEKNSGGHECVVGIGTGKRKRTEFLN